MPSTSGCAGASFTPCEKLFPRRSGRLHFGIFSGPAFMPFRISTCRRQSLFIHVTMQKLIPALLPRILGLVVALPLSAQDDVEKIDARENLGPAINTGSIEIMPIVSPDGKTLYFDRKNDSANTGGVADDDDIYYSTLQ